MDGDIGDQGDPSDNVYRVLWADNVTSETIIDGFTVTGGNAEDGVHLGSGGGMLCDDASPRVVRCIFRRNKANFDGGGVAVFGGDSAATFVNCQFLGNSASTGGGVGQSFGPRFTTFMNCSFVGNVAGQAAGGLALFEHSSASVINCTFVANVSSGIGGGVMSDDQPADPPITVVNTILWGNIPDEWLTAQGCTLEECELPLLAESLVEGGIAGFTVEDGGGNIDDDPEFVRAPDPGADDEWGTADDDYGDLRLSLGSPCINNGSNNSLPADFGDLNSNGDDDERTPRDLDIFRKRVLHATVEMGAHEFGPSIARLPYFALIEASDSVAIPFLGISDT